MTKPVLLVVSTAMIAANMIHVTPVMSICTLICILTQDSADVMRKAAFILPDLIILGNVAATILS